MSLNDHQIVASFSRNTIIPLLKIKSGRWCSHIFHFWACRKAHHILENPGVYNFFGASVDGGNEVVLETAGAFYPFFQEQYCRRGIMYSFGKDSYTRKVKLSLPVFFWYSFLFSGGWNFFWWNFYNYSIFWDYQGSFFITLEFNHLFIRQFKTVYNFIT